MLPAAFGKAFGKGGIVCPMLMLKALERSVGGGGMGRMREGVDGVGWPGWVAVVGRR